MRVESAIPAAGEASDEKPSAPSKRRRARRLAVRIAIDLAAIYALWCLGLYLLQDRLLFPADLAPPPLKQIPSPSISELSREVPGVGRVVAWIDYAPVTFAKDPAPLAVFFHGNAEIIDLQVEIVQGYHKLGCHVLLPEYRGYGRSEGRPGEAEIIDDAAYFIEQARGLPRVDGSRLVLHGRSVGGGPAALLAAKLRPSALVLESTFTSAAAMAASYAAPEFLVRNPFRVDDAIRGLDLPILIFHGSHDDIIPVKHGQRLRDLAVRGTYVEFDVNHNGFPGDRNEAAYWEHIEALLVSAGVLQEPADAK